MRQLELEERIHHLMPNLLEEETLLDLLSVTRHHPLKTIPTLQRTMPLSFGATTSI